MTKGVWYACWCWSKQLENTLEERVGVLTHWQMQDSSNPGHYENEHTTNRRLMGEATKNNTEGRHCILGTSGELTLPQHQASRFPHWEIELHSWTSTTLDSVHPPACFDLPMRGSHPGAERRHFLVSLFWVKCKLLLVLFERFKCRECLIWSALHMLRRKSGTLPRTQCQKCSLVIQVYLDAIFKKC